MTTETRDLAPAPAPRPGPRTEALESILPIEGMTCASCVRRVEKALGEVEGGREASVRGTRRRHARRARAL